ncbi:hypothetical protein KNE206_41620 [Kitasatospora sp. NE20-6]
MILSRVASERRSGLLKAKETADRDTPASFATSVDVTLPRPVVGAGPGDFGDMGIPRLVCVPPR